MSERPSEGWTFNGRTFLRAALAQHFFISSLLDLSPSPYLVSELTLFSEMPERNEQLGVVGLRENALHELHCHEYLGVEVVVVTV